MARALTIGVFFFLVMRSSLDNFARMLNIGGIFLAILSSLTNFAMELHSYNFNIGDILVCRLFHLATRLHAFFLSRWRGELNLNGSLHMLCWPCSSTLVINKQRRLPDGSVICYICIACPNILVWRADRLSWHVWRKLVPLEEYGLTTNAHISLTYAWRFRSYEELHTYVLNKCSLLNSLGKHAVWGEFNLSPSGRALLVGKRCELFALLRMVQPQKIGQKKFRKLFKLVLRGGRNRNITKLIRASRPANVFNDFHISLRDHYSN